ncbi:MAG: heat-inducible transcriptional repressor HrcA [Firmicutes bacterium]|nr:heat-inducible transcriptional repressor HrcA [Bacillota bacterium]
MEDLFTPRQHQILLTIIQEFINTAEPVGSTTLVKRYGFALSPATLRNEMARLEDLGFLFQPHTSSGRIPTDRAYRYYVDFIMQKRIDPPEDVETTLREYERLEAHLHRLVEITVKLLSDITRHTSIVLVPRFRQNLFRYLKITPIEGRRILLILMSNTGAILNKVISLSRDVTEEYLAQITENLNRRLEGVFMENISLELQGKMEDEAQGEIAEHIGILAREVALQDDKGLIYEGTKHLLAAPEFHNIERLRSIFDFLEDEKIISEILRNTLRSEGIKILIGEEHKMESVRECSFITATYKFGSTPIGSLAVIGPTRMPYGRLIPVVNACAEIFTEKLNKLGDLT